MVLDNVYEAIHGNVFVRLSGYSDSFTTTVKLEGLNPAGSIKLKTALSLVQALEGAGRLGPGRSLIESTSGNLGIALASVCAASGYRLTLVTDPNTTPASLRAMRALGAEVIVVTERDRNGGYLQTRIDRLLEMLAADPTLVWSNQHGNPANPRVHREHTAREIVAGFGVPDWLFVGAGTTGTLMGCVEHFRSIQASTTTTTTTTIVAVDSAGSVTFGGPPGRRHIPGLGSSRRPPIFVDDGSFQKVLVDEVDTVRVCRRVAREHGLLLGGSSGTVLAAVDQLSGKIKAGSRVLVISPDLGDRYLDTIYDDDWVLERYGCAALYPQPITTLGTSQATIRFNA